MVSSWSSLLLMVLTGALLITDAQQSRGPIITPVIKEKILQTGDNFTLYCKGNRPVQFKAQESPEENTGLFYMEERNTTSENDSQYEVALDLYNVDHFAVGYYACFDDTVDSNEVLNDIIEEPNDTNHISYIYIYVNGSSLFAPHRSFIIAKGDSKFLVECRPTTPDIKVQLTADSEDVECDNYNAKVGFAVNIDVLSDYLTSIFTCDFERQDNFGRFDIIVHKQLTTQPPKPTIYGGTRYFLEGETFSVNCTVRRERNSAVFLAWRIPGPFYKVINSSNENKASDANITLFKNYTIVNASKEDAGNYTCISKYSNLEVEETITKELLAEAYVNIIPRSKENNLVTPNKFHRFIVDVDAYPPATVELYRNDELITNSSKYVIRQRGESYSITISPLTVYDTANYTVVAKNKFMTKSYTKDIRKLAAPLSPIVNFGPDTNKEYVKGRGATLTCEAVGYPLPEIHWYYADESDEMPFDKKYQNDKAESLFSIVSSLEIKRVLNSSDIKCFANNTQGSNATTRSLLVYELEGGFGIENYQTWFSQYEDVALNCIASKYKFYNVTWSRPDGEELENVEYSENYLSYIAKLKMDHIGLHQAGDYMCVGIGDDDTRESENISIAVEATRPPIVIDHEDVTEEVIPYHPTNLTCSADGVPPPRIEWFKDDAPVKTDAYVVITPPEYIDHTTVSSVLKIKQLLDDYVGKYECRVMSQGTYLSKYYNINMKEKAAHRATYLSIIGVIFFVLIVVVAYLTWKIRKEKQFRKELAAAGLLNFKEGVTKSINPDLGIDEQAELLPYDEKFEFPVEKLTLGKQLGAGAFGVVYKADARGIINAEESTTVAVKMVKKTADNMYIKALASELKIMVHLGKHINIVNLLGACTKNVGKRELIVIVEYCKFGNIHNYLQKHREVFVDQLTDSDKTLGKVNRGFSCSSQNSGSHSDYFGSNHTQETDHTFLNTANTNRSGRKVSETGYVQPEWRSNYECDYSDGRSPRPLFSRDLLAWAFQIARGMEYLASRKVLHGDLAARNVLLAEDNVVKICDFGLARSIYKNDEYQKKENSPLPVKWLAVECMTDRIFSTQSDVWSFGIVLWELFTLAKTPYPNVDPPNLLQKLLDGHRLEKPAHANDKIYDVMKRCWSHKPTARPSFSELQEILGSFLEENVRNHYVDLNAAYMDMNLKKDGEEDYLAMVSAPDYNNLVTPSPHHYVNDNRFFPPTPTQLQHDDEGYLQMSPATRQNIFNARPQGNKFDFDARKLTPRVSDETSYGSELTPMLTLNNLPRSGSESDHENENASQYLNMCPRIEEETDDVFEKTNNVKNVQPSAVTNPTYITLTIDDEKKTQNITNSYINVPNGLVK